MLVHQINRKNQDLLILYLNTRSIRNKITELELIIKDNPQQIDVIICTETWLYKEEENYVNIPQYKSFYESRNENKGGGVAIYVHNSVSVVNVQAESRENCNSLIVQIDCKGTKLNLATFYRPPQASLENSTNFLEGILRNNKNILLIGDVNINLLETTNTVKDYANSLELISCKILNKIDPTSATRETNATRTIIDHIISDMQFKEDQVNIRMEEHPLMDHKLIYLKTKLGTPNRKKYQRLTKTKICFDTFNRKLEEKRIQEGQITTFKQLTDLITACKAESTITKQTKYKTLNTWVNDELIEVMKDRNRAYKHHRANPESQQLKDIYKHYKNKVNNLVKKRKQEHTEKIIGKAERNPKCMWKIINNTLKNTQDNDNHKSKIEKIKADAGHIKEDPKEIANELNKYFTNIGQKLAKDQQMQHPVPLHPIPRNEENMYLFPTDTEEVIKIIEKLKNNKSPGEDGITCEILKKAKEQVASIIADIINKHIQEETFPNEMKHSQIIPIYKAGDKENPGNYRPISLLTTMSKIFETVLKNRIVNFLYKTSNFDENQFGFLKSSNTQTALLEYFEMVYENLNKSKYVLSIFIDLSKAFDTVNHGKLLELLDMKGIRGTPKNIMKSYLSDRTQKTKVDKVLSEPQSISIGVPQGSILGPLLFILYIENIKYVGLQGKHIAYADDMSITYTGNTEKEIQDMIDMDTPKLERWLRGSNLTINTEKTVHTIFKQKNKKEIVVDIKINKRQIKQTEVVKYLGVHIDNKLSWEKHANSIIRKIIPITAALRRMHIPETVRDRIYYALIHPHLIYAVLIWSNARNYVLSKLSKCLNKSLKIIYNKNWYIHTEDLYKEVNKLKLENIIFIERAKTAYQIYKGFIKTNLKIKMNQDLHEHNTRTREVNHMENINNNAGKKTLNYHVHNTFHKLPEKIQKAKHTVSFVQQIKTWCYNKQNT